MSPRFPLARFPLARFPLARFPLEGVVYPPHDRAGLYVERGAWSDRTIPQLLARCAARHPQKPAYICDGREWTFAQLHKASLGVSKALLAAGLRPGDRALFQMGTIAETQIALLGCMNAGIVPVCTIPQHREIEIAAIAGICKPAAYFVQADFTDSMDLGAFAREMCGKLGIGTLVTTRAGDGPGSGLRLEEMIAADDENFDVSAHAPGPADVAVLQLSGGSTGLPKIIPRFHGEYLGHTRLWLDRHSSDEHDIRIWALPLLHNAGMMFTLLGTLIYGATAVLVPRWSPAEYFRLVERHGATQAFTIGPHASIIAAYPDIGRHDLSSLKCFLTLMGAQGIEAATGVTAINMFGITEGLVLTGTAADPADIRHRTIGRPCSELDEVRLLEPGTETEIAAGGTGELCFRGPSSLSGYYRAPDIDAASFTSDGFFRTGDMLREHRIDGRIAYSFEGRLKDNINRGGEKFGTEEIERLLCDHPAISEVVVVAMPDPLYGEKACAFAIPRGGAELPGLEELGRFLTGRGLAWFKVPERIEAIDRFPTTRVGKLDRARLREIVAEKLASGHPPAA